MKSHLSKLKVAKASLIEECHIRDQVKAKLVSWKEELNKFFINTNIVMNTTKIIVTSLLGFIINVASAQQNSANIGYSSDYFIEALQLLKSRFKARLYKRTFICYAICGSIYQSSCRAAQMFIFSLLEHLRVLLMIWCLCAMAALIILKM